MFTKNTFVYFSRRLPTTSQNIRLANYFCNTFQCNFYQNLDFRLRYSSSSASNSSPTTVEELIGDLIPPKLSKSRSKKFKMSDKKLWMPQDNVPEHIQKLLNDNLEQQPERVRLNYVLAFIQIVRLLKTQKRTGWLDHKVPRSSVESISDHMYRMSIITLLITNEEINKDKCVKIAVIHDLAEALVGDITPFDGVEKPEKSRREFETMKYLSSIIEKYNPKAASEILELWLDYEEIRNVEARYVKDIDKFEMIQQAWDYEQQFGTKHNLDMFYRSRASIKTPEIGELCDELIRQRTVWLETQPKDTESEVNANDQAK